MGLRERLHKQITFVDQEIDSLLDNVMADGRDMNIHEMSDLARYSETLSHLTKAMVNLKTLNIYGEESDRGA